MPSAAFLGFAIDPESGGVLWFALLAVDQVLESCRKR
jgi:hypothetical protein